MPPTPREYLETRGRLTADDEAALIAMKAPLAAQVGASVSVPYPKLVELAIEKLDAQWKAEMRRQGDDLR